MKPHKMPSNPALEPAEQEIQHTAYFLWKEAGCPSGQDADLWLAAKELLRHRRQGSATHNPGLSGDELRKECAGNANDCDADAAD